LSTEETPVNKALSILFAALAAILLMNVLIAIMNQKWQEVSRRGEEEYWSKRMMYLERIKRIQSVSGFLSYDTKDIDSSRWTHLVKPFHQDNEYLAFGAQARHCVSAIVCVMVLLVWLLLGLISLGMFWPKQVRRFLFCPQPTMDINNDSAAEVR